MKNVQSQRGNVLFIILIAIGLLGALSFAVSRSNQGNTGAVTAERMRLMASEVLEYSKIVSNAVTQLRLRGCTESQLNFDNDVVTATYVNGGAPSNNTCDIFDLSGGGISWNVPQDGVMTTTPSPSGSWGIYGGNEILGAGTSGGGAANADLVLALIGLQLEVCQQINGLLGVTDKTAAPPQDSGMDTTVFTGSFSASAVVGDEASALEGKKAACFEDTGASKYIYYKVLLSR